MVGSRALQISMGAQYLVKLSEEELQKVHYNPIEIAKLEYDAGILPLDVKRPYPKSTKQKEK
jgi:DNA-directed RNA polymerase subunit K/omega